MKIHETYRYAIVCPTSMGVRITPADRMAVHNSNHFYLQIAIFLIMLLNIVIIGNAFAAETLPMKDRIFPKAVPGASGISLILQIPDSVFERPVSGTIAPAKSDGRFRRRISIWSGSLRGKRWQSCI